MNDERPLLHADGPADLEREAEIQLELLEEMFEDPGLSALAARVPGHPAVRRYQHLIEGLPFSGDRRTDVTMIRGLGQGMFDRAIWAKHPFPIPFWESQIADPDQVKMIKGMITDPESFEDVMAELFVFGALISHEVPVELNQGEGEPDVHVLPPAETWVEAKRIKVGTKPESIRDVLAKASRQIRRVTPKASGAAYVYVTSDIAEAPLGDRVPDDIAAYVREAARTMGSGDDKHVGQVVVGWDDVIVHGNPPDPMLYAVRRRTLELHHKNALSGPAIPDLAAKLGSTTLAWRRFDRKQRLDG